MFNHMNQISGIQIIENIHLTERGPDIDKEVGRTWKERFFSFDDWRPPTKTIKVATTVPSREITMMHGAAYCHPAMAREIRLALS